MNKASVIYSVLFLVLYTSCKNDSTFDTNDHIEVAKTVHLSRFKGDLKTFKSVSTDAAYNEFETETSLFPVPDASELIQTGIVVRTDTVLNDIAWVSLKFKGTDLYSTIKLIRSSKGWKNDLINYGKEESPLKKATFKFPDIK